MGVTPGDTPKTVDVLKKGGGEKTPAFLAIFEMIYVFEESRKMGKEHKDRLELINRTSNSLERYNRWMKYNVFWSMHPNLVIFSGGLEGERKRHVKRIEDARKGREIPAEPKGTSFPPIPEAYSGYCTYAMKGNKKPTRVNPTRKGEIRCVDELSY